MIQTCIPILEVHAMATLSKRDQLVKTATELFAEFGYHATGIDKILQQAGVSKKTLYHHFRSKDELILAVLRDYDSLFRNDFMKQVDNEADSPKGKLLGVYDVAERWFNSDDFFGCMYIKAIGEHSDPKSPFRDVCKQFKKLTRNYLEELCVEAGYRAAAELADQLALLLEGAIVTAQVSPEIDAARIARDAAEIIISAQEKKSH